MANDALRNPIIVDTAHASTVVIGGPRKIKWLKWVGATTAAHTVVLQDKGAARTFWTASATGSGFQCFEEVNMLLETGRELICTTLASGILYIYLDPSS